MMDWNSKLRRAALEGNLEATQEAIAAGAMVDAGDSNGWTALMLAAKYNQSGIVRFLLSVGANPSLYNGLNINALTLAAHGGNQEMVGLLLDSDAPLQGRLDAQLAYGNLLGAMGVPPADLCRSAGCAGPTPDGYYEDAAALTNRIIQLGEIEMFHLLATHPGVVARGEADSCVMESALLTAADVNQVYLIEWLIENGVDVNTTNRVGITPLMLAAGEGNIESIRVLLRAGCTVNMQSRAGHTALMAAAMAGQERAALLLLEYGADARIANNAGESVEAYATKNRMKKLLRTLHR